MKQQNYICLQLHTNEKATFEIIGNKDLKIGDNNIIITVTAENGITTKNMKYQLIEEVYKKNQKIKTRKIQVERLSAILDTKDPQGQNYLKQIQKNSEDNNRILIGIAVLILVVIISCSCLL